MDASIHTDLGMAELRSGMLDSIQNARHAQYYVQLVGEIHGIPRRVNIHGDETAGQSARESIGATATSTHPFGILFVHGIGAQQRGDSLVDWADSIYVHMHRLLTQDDRVERHREAREQAEKVDRRPPKNDKKRAELEALEEEAALMASAEHALDGGMNPVSISGSRLRSNSALNEPSHLVMTMTPSEHIGALLTEDNAAPPTSWMFAESWWAEEFSPPPARVMLRWALEVAPVVILGHFAASLARLRTLPRFSVKRLVGGLVGIVLYLASLAMLIVCLLSLLVLMILGAIPIPRLGAFARGVAAKLAASMGDSYVLVASASEFDAMISRVESDLAWLASHCDRVAVVAHSQGAVIAHRALNRVTSPKVRLFVTIGSGLSKLSEIGMLRTRPPSRRFAWMALAYALIAVAATVILLLTLGLDTFTITLIVVNAASYILMSWFAYSQLVRDRAQEQLRRRRRLRPLVLNRSRQWVDFFASADPVPNGPIFDEDPEWLRSYQTWYESSWLADHSGYRENPDGLVAPLVLELARAAGGDFGRHVLKLTHQVQAIARRRAWRCTLLVRARYTLLIVAAVTLPYYWRGLTQWGTALRDSTPGPVRDVLASVGNALFVPAGVDLHGDYLVAAILGAGVVYAGFTVATWRWRKVGERDLARFYRGDNPDYGGLPLLIFGLVVLLLASAAALPAAAGSLPPDLVPANVIEMARLLLTISGSSFVMSVMIHRLDDEHPPLSDRVELERRNERLLTQSIQIGVIACLVALPMSAVGVAALFLWPNWPTWLDLLLVTTLVTVGFITLLLVAERAHRRVIGRIASWGKRWVDASTRPRGIRDASPGDIESDVESSRS